MGVLEGLCGMVGSEDVYKLRMFVTRMGVSGCCGGLGKSCDDCVEHMAFFCSCTGVYKAIARNITTVFIWYTLARTVVEEVGSRVKLTVSDALFMNLFVILQAFYQGSLILVYYIKFHDFETFFLYIFKYNYRGSDKSIRTKS